MLTVALRDKSGNTIVIIVTHETDAESPQSLDVSVANRC